MRVPSGDQSGNMSWDGLNVSLEGMTDNTGNRMLSATGVADSSAAM
jgi:hypothetical protein